MIIKNGNFKVYLHINKINGKMYAGITKRNPKERWRNGEGYTGCVHFYNAIKKYGWDNFDHYIFADNLTEEEALNAERLLIEKLNLQNEAYGYNIRFGGDNCNLAEETKIKIGNALRGRTYSEEKRKLYSDAHKGKKLSFEHAEAIRRSRSKIMRTEEWNMNIRKGIREKHSGENHWTNRIGMSEKTKNKISKSVKNYYKTHKHVSPNPKKVQCIETGIIYESIGDAAQKLKICRSQISEACVGVKRHTAGGKHWKFV